MTRGFVIMAQDTNKTKYTKCAEVLKKSLLRAMPNSNVTIITTDMLPHGDQAPNSDWKLINDWQVYEASPYDETIKLWNWSTGELLQTIQAYSSVYSLLVMNSFES